MGGALMFIGILSFGSGFVTGDWVYALPFGALFLYVGWSMESEDKQRIEKINAAREENEALRQQIRLLKEDQFVVANAETAPLPPAESTIHDLLDSWDNGDLDTRDMLEQFRRMLLKEVDERLAMQQK